MQLIAPAAILKLSEQCNSRAELTEMVRAAVLDKQNIRFFRNQKEEVLVLSLNLQIEHICKTYAGASNTSQDTYLECVTFIIQQYGSWAVGELTEAFQYVSKNCPDKIQAYYGQMSVAMLGIVMKEYDEYRQGLVKALYKEEQRAADAARQMEKTDYWNSPAGLVELNRLQDERIEKLIRLDVITIDDLNVNDYKVCCARGLELGRGEKWAYYDAAAPILEKQLRDERDEVSAYTVRMKLTKWIDQLSNITDVDLNNKKKVIAEKLAVVDYLNNLKLQKNGN